MGDPGQDPVLAAVIDNRLHSIATQMADTMLRTSRSMIFQSRDFVTGLFTADGRWIATKDYIPVLAGSLPSAYDGIVGRFGDDVHEGDVFILNDPYHGNNHPPDVTIMKPVFYEGVLRFWSVSKGHNADVGGGGVIGYNPYARNCWEDALRIPPVRLYDRGVYQRDVWDLILTNIQLRELVEGDLRCQIGAATVGERELHGVLRKFGVEKVFAAIDYQLAASRRHMEAEIAKLPDGVYHAERLLDDGGAYHREPIAIRLRLEIRGSHATFDFSESDPQVEGYANSTYANTVASSLIGIWGALDPTQRRNSGSTAPVTVVTRPGTVAHAVEPAATTLCTLSACEAIVESIWAALAQAAPEVSNAAWSRAYAFGTAGVSEQSGRPFVALASHGGGSGATEGFDGWDALGSPVAMGGGRMPDLEQHELAAPTTILHIGYETDSGGVGKWRGGLGGVIHWRVDQDNLPLLNWGSGVREETAPFGIEGGGGGTANWSRFHFTDGRVEPGEVNTIRTVNRGDVIEIHIAGGGGYGDPFERDAAAVVRDVRDGAVSAEAAQKDYGVVVDPSTLAVDDEATALLRGARGAARSAARRQPA